MENKESLAYLRAKKKFETLKGFYSHLAVYLIINIGIVLISANLFNQKNPDFYNWRNYVTPFFWGIGLLSHAIYVFFVFNFKNTFLKRWEEKKIKKFLDENQS